MFWKVVHPAGISFGRFTGDAKIADKHLTLSHFLLFQFQNFADSL